MTEPATAEGEGDDGDRTYGGVFGAFPYAARASDSWLFRSYVVVGGLLAAGVAIIFALALVGLLAHTTGARGGVFTFSRAFFIFVGFLVVAPLIAPVLSVARRHRRVGSDRRSDALLAAAGYGFLCTLYLALVISTPVEQQEAVAGPLAVVVGPLYALPAIYGLVPPTLAAAGIYLVHRATR